MTEQQYIPNSRGEGKFDRASLHLTSVVSLRPKSIPGDLGEIPGDQDEMRRGSAGDIPGDLEGIWRGFQGIFDKNAQT